MHEHTQLLWAVPQRTDLQGGKITIQSLRGWHRAAASPKAVYSAVHAWAASELGLSIPRTPSQKYNQDNPQLTEVNPESLHTDCEH